MENIADLKINRFRAKIEYIKENSREKALKHFDALVIFLLKHPQDFQKFQPKNGTKIENIAESKICRFRVKILQQQRLLKHFDALMKFLHKHPEEFQKYQPQRVRNKLAIWDEIHVSSGNTGTNVAPPVEQSPSSTLSAIVEDPIEVPNIDKTLDASDYKNLRSKSCQRASFASEHLMRPGTDKLRQGYIQKYLNGQFQTITVTDFGDATFKQLYDSMGDIAQDRARSMFYKGFYNAKNGGDTFKMSTNGLVLSLDRKIQLKITSPGLLHNKHLLQIDISTFYIEELVRNQIGDYCHWDPHKKPQVTTKPTRSPLKNLDKNSTVRI